MQEQKHDYYSCFSFRKKIYALKCKNFCYNKKGAFWCDWNSIKHYVKQWIVNLLFHNSPQLFYEISRDRFTMMPVKLKFQNLHLHGSSQDPERGCTMSLHGYMFWLKFAKARYFNGNWFRVLVQLHFSYLYLRSGVERAVGNFRMPVLGTLNWGYFSLSLCDIILCFTVPSVYGEKLYNDLSVSYIAQHQYWSEILCL